MIATQASNCWVLFYLLFLYIATRTQYVGSETVIKTFSLPFYLISYVYFASLFENFHISLLKLTSTYMSGIEV